MFTREQAKAFLIQHLTADAEHHDFGRFFRIGEDVDKLDANLPSDAGPRFDKFHTALTFWKAWQVARDNDWQQDHQITPAQWPTFARTIIADLMMDREIQNEVVSGIVKSET